MPYCLFYDILIYRYELRFVSYDESDGFNQDEWKKMENDNIIVLTDEDGIDVEFEFCASIEYEGNEYVVLLPTDDDDGEVVILQVMEDEESDDENTK